MPDGIVPADAPVNTPVVPPTDEQFVIGAAANPQQVPRAVIAAPPSEVTFAPRVAPVVLMAETVGDVTVGAVVDEAFASVKISTELSARL